MSISSDYSTLLNKYNRLAASHKDLQQQLREKTGELRNLEHAAEIVHEQVRKLCEEILAKDRREMVLGRSYTWKSLSVDELVAKATESYRVYNAARADLMTRIMDELEQERINRESLQSQLESLIVHEKIKGGTGTEEFEDEDEVQEDGEAAEIMKPQKENIVAAKTEIAAAPKSPANKEQPKAIGNAPYKIQQAAKSGAIEAIIEDDDDVSDGDLADIEEAARLSDALTSRMNSIPITPAKKIIKQKQERDKQKSEAFVVDLAERRKKMTDLAWIILETVGAHGLSRYAEIDAMTLELYDKSGLREQYEKQGKMAKMTSARVRTTLQSMENIGVLQRESIATPFVSHLLLYSLAPMGTSLFRDRFGKDPVLSERDKIVAEHDNVEHGFGIVTVSEMFRESGFFSEVVSSPTKNTIKLEGNARYIPDIITQGKHKGYYEYERGMHNQSNFEIKINKMTRVTNYINIVTNSRKNVTMISKQVEKWIESRGGYRTLTGKRVRIATAISLKEKNPELDASWDMVYDMKSDKPIVNAPDLQK
jgi:hypothetical protein